MTSMRTCICACVRAYLWPPTSSCAALGESLSLSGLCVFPDDMEGTGPGSGPGVSGLSGAMGADGYQAQLGSSGQK